MNSAGELRRKVRDAYSAAAVGPDQEHAFPVGRAFAESLGYPPELLRGLPAASVEAFSGVSNVSVFAEIPRGAGVLDVGCGAGLDSLVAAKRVGPNGRVVAVDFSEAMLERASASAREAGAGNVVFCRADAEHLPVPSESIDVALVNGIFNLNPARQEIFRELGRVVRRGGVVFAAELILREALPASHQTESNWFA